MPSATQGGERELTAIVGPSPYTSGFYYEGWILTGKPVKERRKEEFLAHIAQAFRNDERIDPEQVVRAVFRVLSERITAGEISDVKHLLPAALRELWLA